PRMRAAEDEAYRQRKPFDCQFRMRTPGGRMRWLHCRAAPREGAQPDTSVWDGIAIDVTDRKLAEQALSESEAAFRTLFDLAGVGKAQADPATGRFVRVNPKLCEITGYTAEELLGLTFADITHPDDRERDLALFRQLVTGEIDVESIDKRYVRK